MELNLAISARRAGFLALTLGALIFSFVWAPQSLAQAPAANSVATDDIADLAVTEPKLADGAATQRTLSSGALVR